MQLADEIHQDPYKLYTRLRREGTNVAHDDAAGLTLVIDYDGVKRGITDPETYGSNLVPALGNVLQWLPFLDPPRHTQLRAIVNRAFTPRSVAALDTRIRALAGSLADELIAAGPEVDLVAGFSTPLPVRVISELLGLPPSDWRQLAAWSETLATLTNTSLRGGAAEAEAAFAAIHAEIGAYLDSHVAERRRHPADDLLTRLVQAEVEGPGLTGVELLHFFDLLLVAGTETTTNLISNTMIAFTEHPAELARVRADPTLMPAAIEEVLRYLTPVQTAFRVTRRPALLGGRELPAGRYVLFMLGAANRDPAQFPDPDRFDVSRAPNPHLAFSHGIHFCAGAPLARLEAQIAVSELLARMRSFELVTADWPRHVLFHVLGPSALPIRFTT